ncbi:MAG: hypothetical protein Q9214_006104, partial [Letrouitia sp. 1 TL-2023]
MPLEQAEQAIFDWLSTTHYSQKHHEMRKKRLMNTGKWLLECDTFKNWKQQRYITLCCTGDPGVGKSVLTSLVIDNLQDSYASDVEMLAYFYFDYQTSQTQTAGAFICGILRQLLGSMSFLPKSLLSFYAEHKNERAPEFQDELRNILLELFNEFESHIVIIDAFDECQNPSDRKAILNVLTQLESRGARLFITSRPHCPDIFQAFESKEVLPVKAHEHDIRAYCRSSIDLNDTTAELVDNSSREQILNTIATHAQG